MLLQQPHGDPEIQHYEKFQQQINKKNREQDPETHTEVKHAKALFSFQTSKPVQLVAEQCHQIIFHGYLYFEDYHLLWIHRAQWRAYEWNGPVCCSYGSFGSYPRTSNLTSAASVRQVFLAFFCKSCASSRENQNCFLTVLLFICFDLLFHRISFVKSVDLQAAHKDNAYTAAKQKSDDE